MSLSTHVLDTTAGEPVPGVPVRLERSGGGAGRGGAGGGAGGGWVAVASGTTDADGRLRDWVPDGEWAAGTYRLVFDVDGPFFPEVLVVFRVTEPDRHLHVPLLLGRYGYTTYRGS